MNKRTAAWLTAICWLLALGLTACGPLAPESGNTAVISELMAKNNGVLADDQGNYPDWIELHNPTDSPLDLKGYSLTDNARNKGKFTFPSLMLEPDAYLVVYASGTELVDAEKRVVHLPFSINAKKEDVYLFNARGREVGHVEVRDLTENRSCGPDDTGKTVWFREPTPGKANAEAVEPALKTTRPAVDTADIHVRINEYAPESSITLADEDGEFTAWAELYNAGEKPVSLAGFTLSDDAAKTDKWTFPDVTIPAGGYQLVYLSGKDKPYEAGGAVHAGFVLSGKEERLTLYAGGKAADSCPVYELTSNLSCGRAAQEDTWVFFAKPTPGKANDTPSFDSIDSARYPKNKTTVLSEAAAVNRTGVMASDKQRYDYIELHNPSDKPVSLKGCRLSDKKELSRARGLPDVTIPAGGYRLVFCGDKDGYNSRTGEIFVEMGLKRTGEHLYLVGADGGVMDDIQTGRLDDAVSCGRVSDTDGAVYYFDVPTPGAANPGTGLGGPAPTPVFSAPDGYIAAGTRVSVSCPGAVIRYTTDGSEPTRESPVYRDALTVTKTVTIRARAFMDGRLPSDDSAGSYITGRRHDMPVLFLSTDPDNLYDESTGLLTKGPGYTETFPHVGANYWKDWERPVHVEYVDEHGQAQLEFNAGLKVFGQYSRAMDQKSLSINLRDKYGPTEFCYPLFGEGAATNVFSELVLRNSGQDGASAHIRDAYVSQVLKGQMDVDIMDYRPVAVYINGSYNGLYDLREKICESYVSNRTGAPENTLDIIKGNSIVIAGSNAEHTALIQYIRDQRKKGQLSSPAFYAYMAARVDIDELMNYWIAVTFFGNTDTGNIKFYRQRADGAKWRWIVYDQDWALSPSTRSWNQLEEVIKEKGHGVGNAFYSDILNGLLHNAGFRERFISLYGKALKTVFAEERLLSVYDKVTAELKSEMPYHIERWSGTGSADPHAKSCPSSMTAWENSIAQLRGFLQGRGAKIRQDIIETFSCTGGAASHKYAAEFRMSVQEITALLDKA